MEGRWDDQADSGPVAGEKATIRIVSMLCADANALRLVVTLVFNIEVFTKDST